MTVGDKTKTIWIFRLTLTEVMTAQARWSCIIFNADVSFTLKETAAFNLNLIYNGVRDYQMPFPIHIQPP